jgi:hypothetical protein
MPDDTDYDDTCEDLLEGITKVPNHAVRVVRTHQKRNASPAASVSSDRMIGFSLRIFTGDKQARGYH